MIKFEQLNAEDKINLTLEILLMMFDGEHRTVEELASTNGQTVHELWQDVCDEVGLDECEPWQGFPAGVRKESFASAPGADRPLPDYLENLLEVMRAIVGRDKQ